MLGRQTLSLRIVVHSKAPSLDNMNADGSFPETLCRDRWDRMVEGCG